MGPSSTDWDPRTQNQAVNSRNPNVNTRLLFNPLPVSYRCARLLGANIPPCLNIYVYPVRPKRNNNRTGVCVSQYVEQTSSAMYDAVISVRPSRPRMTAMKDVAAEGLLKSLGVGCWVLDKIRHSSPSAHIRAASLPRAERRHSGWIRSWGSSRKSMRG